MSRKIQVRKGDGFDHSDVSAKTTSLVNDLFKSDNILKEQEIIKKLKELYNDNDKLVRKAYKYFSKRYDAINEHAKLFKEKLLSTYQYLDLPKIIKKAQQYASKYHMSDAEFHLFMNLIKKDNSGKYHEFQFEEQTPMGKALGYETKKLTSLSYDNSDKVFLDKIIAYYQQSLPLNQKIKVQSLQYSDCDYVALSGKYDEHYDNQLNFVHPLLAAMFIPKITALEERIVMTNIAGIVNSIYTMRPIKDYPNKLLYEDIATDKNQSAYTKMTPFEDLYIRAMLQAKIWEGIFYLRTGKYYKFDNDQFNKLIAKYPANIFDSPDMIYTQDSGNVLRRILNAFSLKPSIVRVIKTADKIASFDNTMFKQKTVENKKHVNAVSVINIRLPTDDSTEYNLTLSDNLTSSQWFSKSDNLTPVNYEQKIIKSEGVIFFYVNRNYNTISINTEFETKDLEEKLLNRHNIFSSNGNYMVNSIPYIFSDTQRLNKRRITAEPEMMVNGDKFVLKSCVITESIKLDEIDIAGNTSAIIFGNAEKAYYYNPSRAGVMTNSSTEALMPVSAVDKQEALEYCATNGIIYIYGAAN